MARVESSASLDDNLRDVCDNDFRFPPIQGNLSRHSHGFALVLLRIRELPRARRRYPSRESEMEMGSVLTFDTSKSPSRRRRLEIHRLLRFDLLLHVMHHGHGSDQDDGCDYLVQVKAGMKESPSDAYRGQR